MRVEHLDEARGIAERSPRLSWRLPDGVHRQLGYELRATVDDGPPVLVDRTDPRSVLVDWPWPPLPARARVDWQVRVVSDAGRSEWSDLAHVEIGLDRDDWVAAWVAPVEDDRPAPGERPGYLLRRAFDISGEGAAEIGDRIGRARVYATAHGLYELFVNGSRVGDAELTPGYTSYRANLAYQTYDVTSLLHTGRNVSSGCS